MPINGKPQIIVGPSDSASLILDNSVFESQQITLNGNTNSNGLLLSTTGDIVLDSNCNIIDNTNTSLKIWWCLHTKNLYWW